MKPGDVLQEQQRGHAFVAQFDEMCTLERRFAEQHAVVGHDPDRVAVDAGEAGHQRGAVIGLEFGELAAVDDAGDDLVHVVGHARVDGDDVVRARSGRRPRRPSAPPPTAARVAARAWRRCGARSAARRGRRGPNGL